MRGRAFPGLRSETLRLRSGQVLAIQFLADRGESHSPGRPYGTANSLAMDPRVAFAGANFTRGYFRYLPPGELWGFPCLRSGQ